MTEEQEQKFNRYYSHVFGGSVDNGIYSNVYNPKLILKLALDGYKIKGLGKSSPIESKELETVYSKILSKEQVNFVKEYKTNPRLLMGHVMGKGKTPSSVICSKEVNAKRILISTTKSTMTNWRDEFFKFGLTSDDKNECLTISFITKGIDAVTREDKKAVQTFTNKKTLFGEQPIKEITDISNREKLQSSNVILVTHAAMVDGENLFSYLNSMGIIDMLIIDEAHEVANFNSKRGTELLNITKNNKITNLLLLTGTAITKVSTQEVYFYFNFLYPGLFNHYDLTKMFTTRKDKKMVLKNISRLQELLMVIMPHRLTWDKDSLKEQGLGELKVNKVFCKGTKELETKVQSIDLSKKNALMKATEKSFLFLPHKQQKAIELIEKALKTKKKIVVFSYYNNVIQELFKLYQDKAVFINGDTPAIKRGEFVNRFHKDESCQLFFGNITATGTGVNLFNADYTIVIEPSYRATTVQQAIARTYRRGNKSPLVEVDLIFMEGQQLENNKVNIIDKKAHAFSMILDGKSDSITGKENTTAILDDNTILNEKLIKDDLAKRQTEHLHSYERSFLTLNKNRQKLIKSNHSSAIINIHENKINSVKKELKTKYPWFMG